MRQWLRNRHFTAVALNYSNVMQSFCLYPTRYTTIFTHHLLCILFLRFRSIVSYIFVLHTQICTYPTFLFPRVLYVFYTVWDIFFNYCTSLCRKFKRSVQLHNEALSSKYHKKRLSKCRFACRNMFTDRCSILFLFSNQQIAPSIMNGLMPICSYMPHHYVRCVSIQKL